MHKRLSVSFKGLKPRSLTAQHSARGASRKSGSKCETALRSAIWRRGFRFRICDPNLPGRPDLVFRKYRLVVFCDGDFWHGRRLNQRLAKLRSGHNADYWVAKIRNNVLRDRLTNRRLRDAGWRVVRIWETDILADVEGIVNRLTRMLTE